MTLAMTVNFHGNVLYGTRIGEAVFVALKPIVEAMGLQWAAQLKRLKRNQVFSKGMSMMDIPSLGGRQSTVGLRLDLLPGWLVTVEAARVKSEQVRAKIVLFQSECYDVLARHFLRKHSSPDSIAVAQESLSVRMAHEARLLFGKRAGAEVWFARGLPRTESMIAPIKQGDLFEWGLKASP